MSSFGRGAEGLLALALPRQAEHRAITAENPTGRRGGGGGSSEGSGALAARDLGVGWKVSPSRRIEPGERLEIAAIEGPGVIEHVWLATRAEMWRSLVLRISWDGADDPPAVAVPLGDFFCQGWAEYAPLMSELVVVAPYGALNCFFPMPFRSSATVSVENLAAEEAVLYYQLDYSLRQLPEDTGYLHAHWRRSNPVRRGEVHTIVEGVEGRGCYLGTYLAVGVTTTGWWGEGEVKFYLDDDGELPTVCGTGTEDYFGGAWNFDVPGEGYTTFSSSFLGMHQVIKPDGLYRSQTRFGMYRWHVPDPIDFRTGLRATIQDLGWRADGRYLQRSDDIASVAYWYSDQASGLPASLTLEDLEVSGEVLRRR
ncbi:MAG TPA: glycoside hydrolase family 172 protein [Acidimicrobiales bacterium]|nr:glycoside hydrolase family 172 protein [Acidimicrobiales bacterium]